MVMAWFKYEQCLSQCANEAYDRDRPPGTLAPFTGIYRCAGCQREIAATEGQPLPSRDHHSHRADQGSIRWRLIVYADHEPQQPGFGADTGRGL
jgi:hypothetical protein